MIYLDYAATGPVDGPALDAMVQAASVEFGNPSSIHQGGRRAKASLLDCRRRLGDLLGIQARDIYFTSGGTEANNWALKTLARTSLARGRHIVATSIEHPSVLEVLKYLEGQGFEVSYLPPLEGNFSPSQFLQASREDTIGWVAMSVNNETGTIFPVHEIGRLALESGFWFHTDTVQSVGYPKLFELPLPASSFVASAHKFGGPKGVGFLAFPGGAPLEPFFHGGGQEGKLRSGTENLPGILAMVLALESRHQRGQALSDHYQALAQCLHQELDQAQIDYQLNSKPQDTLPAIQNLWIQGMDASQLLIQLDLAGFAVSAGSACSAGSLGPSPVLQSLRPDQAQAWQESIRLSFGPETSQDEIKQFVKTLKSILGGK